MTTTIIDVDNVTGWRTNPPTVAEVQRFRWWWVRRPRAAPAVLELTVESRGGSEVVVIDGRGALHAEDWGDAGYQWRLEAEWALALPPG